MTHMYTISVPTIFVQSVERILTKAISIPVGSVGDVYQGPADLHSRGPPAALATP